MSDILKKLQQRLKNTEQMEEIWQKDSNNYLEILHAYADELNQLKRENLLLKHSILRIKSDITITKKSKNF
ncbi:MAG: hypothetical protein ACI86H_001510 [bacterium]|jgi:hypothetical protein